MQKISYLDLEKEREKFVKDYPVKDILKLSLEEYCIGDQSRKTFCYRLEFILGGLGSMRGSPSTKFGVWYGKRKRDIDKKYRCTSKYDTDQNINIAFENVKNEIVKLLSFGKTENYDAMRKSKLCDIFRGKLLSTYYPKKYLPIFSKKHLEYFLTRLNITYKSKDIFDMQRMLIDYKNSKEEYKKVSLFDYSKMLYSAYRPKDDERIKDNEMVYDDDELCNCIVGRKNVIDTSNELPEEKVSVRKINKHSGYPRSIAKAQKALARANYICEYNHCHKSFEKAIDGNTYVEPHHLIPICEHMHFEKSLDHRANIVALCSNCHNEIHYGKYRNRIIEELYKKRKDELEKAGISVDLETLKKYYKGEK